MDQSIAEGLLRKQERPPRKNVPDAALTPIGSEKPANRFAAVVEGQLMLKELTTDRKGNAKDVWYLVTVSPKQHDKADAAAQVARDVEKAQVLALASRAITDTMEEVFRGKSKASDKKDTFETEPK